MKLFPEDGLLWTTKTVKFVSKLHSNQQWNLLNINRDFLVEKKNKQV